MTDQIENTNVFKAALYEPQRQLFDRIKQSFAEGKPVAVVAGQRAGKQMIQTALALDYEHVVVMTNLPLKHAKACYDDLVRNHPNHVPFFFAPNFFGRAWNSGALPGSRDKSEVITKDTLVLMDDPYWWGGRMSPEAFFLKVAEHTHHVLAIGSRGPRAFESVPMWSYATWDLNPHHPRSDFDAEFARDPVKAQRDFGG